MPSLNDFYTQVTQVNSNLQQADTDLNNGLHKIDNDLNAGFQSTINVLNQLVKLQIYADHALFHIAQQNDTVICILEHISQNTCTLVNEAHQQTELQTSIKYSSETLLELYKSTHAEAALALERIEALQKDLAACCPPQPPKPVCNYEHCVSPQPMRDLPDKGLTG